MENTLYCALYSLLRLVLRHRRRRGLTLFVSDVVFNLSQRDALVQIAQATQQLVVTKQVVDALWLETTHLSQQQEGDCATVEAKQIVLVHEAPQVRNCTQSTEATRLAHRDDLFARVAVVWLELESTDCAPVD